VLWFLSRTLLVWGKGYRLRPWRSPYLRWRIETFWGLHADRIGMREFIGFTWRQRRDLLRFAKWASKMPPAIDTKAKILESLR